jgi:thiol-disulfide isomerase/thioredoxin
MDRLRHLIFTSILVACLPALGCNNKATPTPAPGRFDAVKSQDAPASLASFCERNLPAQGEGATRYSAAPLREIAGHRRKEAAVGKWHWLNLWASWCGPCLEEMALLAKWKQALHADGIDVDLELMSIDEEEAPLLGALKREMPGRVSWLRSNDDLAPFLSHLGVDKNSAIPIHAFVDPQGNLRCVRVGSVRESDFGTIRTLVGGG